MATDTKTRIIEAFRLLNPNATLEEAEAFAGKNGDLVAVHRSLTEADLRARDQRRHRDKMKAANDKRIRDMVESKRRAGLPLDPLLKAAYEEVQESTRTRSAEIREALIQGYMQNGLSRGAAEIAVDRKRGNNG